MNVPAALQVVAVVSLADLRELSLGEGERHVEEQRQVGTRQVVVTEFQVQNPLREAVAPLAGRKFRTLETHVRIDVTVEDHGFAFGDPRPDLRTGRRTVAREEQGHQIGIDRLDGTQFAAQETGDQIAENRRVETREMEVTARDAAPCEKLLQHADLGRLARSVQSFEYDEHKFRQ